MEGGGGFEQGEEGREKRVRRKQRPHWGVLVLRVIEAEVRSGPAKTGRKIEGSRERAEKKEGLSCGCSCTD